MLYSFFTMTFMIQGVEDSFSYSYNQGISLSLSLYIYIYIYIHEMEPNELLSSCLIVKNSTHNR